MPKVFVVLKKEIGGGETLLGVFSSKQKMMDACAEGGTFSDCFEASLDEKFVSYEDKQSIRANVQTTTRR